MWGKKTLILIFIFIKLNAYCQNYESITVIAKDFNGKDVVSIKYFNSFLEEKEFKIDKNKDSLQVFIDKATFFQITNLTTDHIKSPILLKPGDTLIISVSNKQPYIHFKNKSALEIAFSELNYYPNLSINNHSGYIIVNGKKSEINQILNETNKKFEQQLEYLKKAATINDSTLLKQIINELASYRMNNLLQPFNQNIIEKSDYTNLNKSYNDSIKYNMLLLDKLYNDKLGNTEYLKALDSYLTFLCRDSITHSNEFEMLFNASIKNFVDEKRDFLMVNTLKKYKDSKPKGYFEGIGKFYTICNDTVKLNYVKDKIDDSLFVYPKLILETKFWNFELNKEETWAEILEKNKGKILYLDFWTSWCPPCIGEIPFQKEIYKPLIENGVIPINISFDVNKNKVNKIFKKYNFQEKSNQYWLQDPRVFARFLLTRKLNEYELIKYPTYILINKNGKIITTNAFRPSQFENLKIQIEFWKKFYNL